MPSFTITPLTGHTGAEVVGLDFTKAIDADTRATLNQAFAEHHVLVMRDQHLGPEEFKAAAQVFGELQQHDKKEHHVPGHPDVYYVSNDEIVNGRRIIPGETFHTDHSNHPRPPKATMLYAALTNSVDMEGELPEELTQECFVLRPAAGDCRARLVKPRKRPRDHFLVACLVEAIPSLRIGSRPGPVQRVAGLGGKLVHSYLTMGRYDLVTISEASDDMAAAKVALTIGSAGNVTTETLRAFTEDEYRQIVDALP